MVCARKVSRHLRNLQFLGDPIPVYWLALQLRNARICFAQLFVLLPSWIWSAITCSIVPTSGRANMEQQMTQATSPPSWLTPPYHNVKDGLSYPSVLFVCGDKDTRCNPAHARKMAARLKDHPGQRFPIMVDHSC